MRDAASSDILAVRKRAVPRNRMREILTSGSVGGLPSNRWLYLDVPCSLHSPVTPPWAEGRAAPIGAVARDEFANVAFNISWSVESIQ